MTRTGYHLVATAIALSVTHHVDQCVLPTAIGTPRIARVVRPQPLRPPARAPVSHVSGDVAR